jgi:hypothetical protein
MDARIQSIFDFLLRKLEHSAAVDPRWQHSTITGPRASSPFGGTRPNSVWSLALATCVLFVQRKPILFILIRWHKRTRVYPRGRRLIFSMRHGEATMQSVLVSCIGTGVLLRSGSRLGHSCFLLAGFVFFCCCWPRRCDDECVIRSCTYVCTEKLFL